MRQKGFWRALERLAGGAVRAEWESELGHETDRAVREASAGDARAKAVAGNDFADLARKLSEDGKADKGGDWGWMDMRDLRPELAVAIKAMKTNSVSGVVSMDGDYYLLKLEDRHEAGPTPFEDVRSAIEKDLRRKEIRRLNLVWMEQLRKDAYIQIVEATGR